MHKIIFPTHLIIAAGISIVGLLTILLFRKKLFSNTKELKKLFWISASIFLAFYLITVGKSIYYDIYYQWEVYHYDLNNDGFFTGEEVTQEQQQAVFRLINDTGRNYSFIVGLLTSFILGAAFYASGWLYLKRKK